MKFFRRSLRTLIGIILILFVAGLIVLKIDSINTSYLKINITDDQSTSFIITNINIVPMTMDTVLIGQSILVRDGYIEEIGKTVREGGLETFNGRGLFLSPGLIDMHVHIWDRQELGLYLANGVTTIRNLWGIPFHLRLKRQIEKEKIYGPQFFVGSPKLTGELDKGDDKVQLESPEQARETVKRYEKQGYDFIKTYAGLPKDILDAIIDQSLESDIVVVSHPTREVPYLDQFHEQVASMEHAEEIVQQPLKYQLDSLRLEVIINKFINTNTSFCPTLTGYYKIYEMLNMEDVELPDDKASYINPLMRKFDSEVQYSRWRNEKMNNSSITQEINRQHQFHLYIIQEMNRAGVNIICGTDAGIGITEPGFSIHEELDLYKDAGMTNYEVLKTATINPSTTHEEFQLIGSIENGKWANFSLTKENPLENLKTLREPELIVIKGRKIDKDLLGNFTEKAKSRKNLIVTALRYAEYLIAEQ